MGGRACFHDQDNFDQIYTGNLVQRIGFALIPVYEVMVSRVFNFLIVMIFKHEAYTVIASIN